MTKIAEDIKATKRLINTLDCMIDEIEFVIKELESNRALTEADEKLLKFAKHLQKHYA